MKNGNQDWRPITLDRAFSKSTKNMLVFTAAKEGGAVPSLYISKAPLGNTPPAKLTLTIATAPEAT
jgi:hypothetical protein